MVYIALLRGINVGGNSRVEMARLQKVFEELGCVNIRTYINSGNVIFTDKRSKNELRRLLTAAIEKEFGFNIPVILRNSKEINEICESIPHEWTNDVKQKTDVMFLWDEIDSIDILEKVTYKPEIENVLYLPGALVWNIGRENVKKGSGVKLIKTDIYKYMTVRNINTVQKLNELSS